MFKPEIFQNRRNLLKKIINNGVIVVPGNIDVSFNYQANTYRFRQDSNFLYFFGLDFSDLAGIIDIDENKEIIFGNDMDIEDIIWMGEQPHITELAIKAGINKTLPFHKLSGYISDAVSKGRTIHYPPPYRAETYSLIGELTGISNQQIKDKASIPLIKAIVELRSRKEPCEVEEIEKMVNVAREMHITGMKMAKPGIREREIAGIIEGICLSAGGCLSFSTICSMHGEILHNPYQTGQLAEDKLLLIDAGAESDLHYASDITRTTPVGGKFSQKQKDVYEIVLAANMNTIEKARVGIPYLDIHLEAAEIITEGLKNLNLMKGNVKEAVAKGAHALFFPHGLGHMLGLDAHDMESLGENFVGYTQEITRSNQFGLAYLRLARKLEPGFVITDEPGIYFIPALIDKWKAEKKFMEFINYHEVEKYRNFGGIRIEDDLLITESGCNIIGRVIPKTVNEIENVVAAAI